MKRLLSNILALSLLAGCAPKAAEEAAKPRLALFVGLDISRSFIRGPQYDDALKFLAHYLYAHLNGLGGLEKPESLFVSSIGGAKPGEPKTFYPRQTFEGKPVEALEEQLKALFPKNVTNPYTDYNAFFEQVAATVKSKNLVLRPIALVMFSDGVPYGGSKSPRPNYGRITLAPLESLSRNITLRLLYTDAVVGNKWQTQVKRRRVKVWTQDAAVMAFWKDPAILLPGKPLEEQTKFFDWLKDNVDFRVRARRVR